MRERAARRNAFSLAKAGSIGLKVRTVGLEEPELGADGFDRGAHAGCLWTARLSRTTTCPGHNVGTRTRSTKRGRWIVDRPVEDGRGAEAVEPEGGDNRVRLPLTARREVAESRVARTAAGAPQEIGRHAAFIENDILPHVPLRLPGLPLPARRGDIRPALLVGVYRFLLRVNPYRADRPPQRLVEPQSGNLSASQ